MALKPVDASCICGTHLDQIVCFSLGKHRSTHQASQKLCSWFCAIVDSTTNTQSWTTSRIPFAFVNAAEQQKQQFAYWKLLRKGSVFVLFSGVRFFICFLKECKFKAPPGRILHMEASQQSIIVRRLFAGLRVCYDGFKVGGTKGQNLPSEVHGNWNSCVKKYGDGKVTNPATMTKLKSVTMAQMQDNVTLQTTAHSPHINQQ